MNQITNENVTQAVDLDKLLDKLKRLFPRPGAADYISVSIRTLDSLVRNGDLPVVRIGRRVLLDRADLDAYVDRVKAAGSVVAPAAQGQGGAS